MRVVLQRVSSASVRVAGEIVGETGPGLLLLVGVAVGDSDDDARALAAKALKLRVFPDGDGLMNRSLKDIGGGVLAVSQFTLLGDARKGNRPSFMDAARPEEGRRLFDLFVSEVRAAGVPCGTGRFGEHMEVALVNDGPVTILLDSR